MLYQPVNASRLHSICAIDGGRLDCRAAGGHQPDVWTLYTFRRHPCDDLIPTTVCWPGLYGMDLDIWYASIACTRSGGSPSRAQAGSRSITYTTATRRRKASSHSTHRELVCVAR